MIARDVIDTARHNGVTITWRKRWRNSVGLAFEVRFHRTLSVAADELARPVSLQLRSHLIDGSAGAFRLNTEVRLQLRSQLHTTYGNRQLMK